MPLVLRGPLTLLGRLFLCAIFLLSAVGNKIPNFSQVAAIMETAGVPFPKPMLAGAILFLTLGGLAVLLGYKARFGAVLLLVFLALATYYFHPFWKLEGQDQQNQMIQALKNLAIAGGLIMVLANGPGPWSLDAQAPRPIVGPATRPRDTI